MRMFDVYPVRRFRAPPRGVAGLSDAAPLAAAVIEPNGGTSGSEECSECQGCGTVTMLYLSTLRQCSAPMEAP